MSKYDRTEEYTGTWEDRSHWNRQWENQWQQKAIGNIEDFLSNTDWDSLGGSYDPESNEGLSGMINNLKAWNEDRQSENQRDRTDIDYLRKDLDAWNEDRRLENEADRTDITDIQKDLSATGGGLGQQVAVLESYFSDEDQLTRLSDLDNVIQGAFGNVVTNEKGEVISGTMSEDGTFISEGAGTQALAKLYADSDANLQTGLQGLRDQIDSDWMDKTFGQRDEEGNLVGGGMTFDEISQSITKQDQTTAGLKEDFTGLFKTGGAGDIALSKLFEQDDQGNYTGDIGTALTDLTTDLTDKYNLDNLDTRFSSLETSAATVADLDKRLKVGGHIDTELGKIGGLTADVGNIQSDLKGLTGEGGTIDTLRGDAEQWVSDLSTSAQTERDRIEQMVGTASTQWNQRLTDLSASMDYRTLGDSATGVRTRKSKARSLGKTNFGTGQLNRSMRTLSGLNL